MRAIWPGALLVVYLGATGLLLLLGGQRVPPGGAALHFTALAAIAAATWLRSMPRWVRAWAPLFALLFLYSEMPMLIEAAGHREMLDASVIRWELAMFGGQPALEWAARWPNRVFSEAVHLAYLSYYPIIFVVPVVLYASSRHTEFSEAVLVLMATFVVCFVMYLVFPVAGPRYEWASSSSAPTGPVRSFVSWLLEERSSRGTAFPSSHVAVAVTQSFLAWRYLGKRGGVVGGVTVCLAAGAVYGGFHYAVDVIAGAVVGAATSLGWILARARLGGGAPLQANATAPT